MRRPRSRTGAPRPSDSLGRYHQPSAPLPMAPPLINPTPEHPRVPKPHAATLRPSTICPEMKEGRRREARRKEEEQRRRSTPPECTAAAGATPSTGKLQRHPHPRPRHEPATPAWSPRPPRLHFFFPRPYPDAAEHRRGRAAADHSHRRRRHRHDGLHLQTRSPCTATPPSMPCVTSPP